MSNEVAKKKSQEVATENDVKSMLFSSSGFEGTTSDSFAIPLVKIVQDLSPVLKKTKPEYNAEAELGDFFNPATGELLKDMDVRVLSIDHQLTVWKPQRGGLVNVVLKTPENEKEIVTKKDGLKKWDRDGNDVIDTLMFTCCKADDLTASGLFFIPFAVSHLKYGRAWTSRIKGLKLDPKTMKPAKDGVPCATWAGVWNISTKLDSNQHGEWYTIGTTPKVVKGIEAEELDAIGELLKIVKTAEKNYGDMESDHGATSDTVQGETEAF